MTDLCTMTRPTSQANTKRSSMNAGGSKCHCISSILHFLCRLYTTYSYSASLTILIKIIGSFNTRRKLCLSLFLSLSAPVFWQVLVFHLVTNSFTWGKDTTNSLEVSQCSCPTTLTFGMNMLRAITNILVLRRILASHQSAEISTMLLLTITTILTLLCSTARRKEFIKASLKLATWVCAYRIQWYIVLPHIFSRYGQFIITLDGQHSCSHSSIHSSLIRSSRLANLLSTTALREKLMRMEFLKVPLACILGMLLALCSSTNSRDTLTTIPMLTAPTKPSKS